MIPKSSGTIDVRSGTKEQIFLVNWLKRFESLGWIKIATTSRQA